MHLIPSICCTKSLGEAFCNGFLQNMMNKNSMGYFSPKTVVVWDNDLEKYEAIVEPSLFGRMLTGSPSSVTENRTVVDLSKLSISEDSVNEWIEDFTEKELQLLSSALKYYRQFALAFAIDTHLYEMEHTHNEEPCPLEFDMEALMECCKCLDINEFNEIYVIGTAGPFSDPENEDEIH